MELNTVLTGGHSQMVLCLGVNAGGQVASGGEGGEVCFWSPDGEIVSQKSFPSRADVNSVCFPPQQGSVVYVSAGEVIELLDIRSPECSQATFAFHNEDVNQITVDPKDGFLAACDDDGLIKVIDLRSHKVLRTLKGHSAICSSVRYHPTVPREIASGGLDCVVHLWETTRASPRTSVNMREVTAAGMEDELMPSPYMVNPPFVHSLDFSPAGDVLACGLESARVQLLGRGGRRDLWPGASLEGHTRGVTQVAFVPNHPGRTQDLLLTAGNDCRMMLWETANITSEDSFLPENSPSITSADKLETIDLTSTKSKIPPAYQSSGSGRERESDKRNQGACSSALKKKKATLSMKHKDKINWLAPSTSVGSVNLVFVADVSEIISVYQWKLA
ncbi:WD repeat-containing protein 53-like [Acanthaster planci]|uniref:WD repeat-containing protein 53-like n=1 Tax=Acanthaster planci TaxID=133434 RepID=A0A8B7YL89_ACAPL|nr:WD repeat-containing protein 53-like [Acanthaster planci]XP_022093402.1 WD repeat-containing protein 53-like [Acanthaster planci]